MFHTTKKQIILVRHAKALEREEWSGKDFDRPLHERGIRSITIMANYLSLIGVKPDRIISSPSVRTLKTAELLQKRFRTGSVESFADLYNESRDSDFDVAAFHLALFRSMNKTDTTLMLVGHNPDLTDIASYLTGEDVPYMKKGSVIVLAVPENLEWKDIRKGSVDLVYYLTPQFLRLEDLVEE
jgi:phosphohistidine phosphatase